MTSLMPYLLEVGQSVFVGSELSLKGLMAHVLGMKIFGIPENEELSERK